MYDAKLYELHDLGNKVTGYLFCSLGMGDDQPRNNYGCQEESHGDCPIIPIDSAGNDLSSRESTDS